MSDKATTTEPTQAEMCRAIAEKVMGWQWIPGIANPIIPAPSLHLAVDLGCGMIGPPDYFTDPAAMVEVMEKLSEEGPNECCVQLTDYPPSDNEDVGGPWTCKLQPFDRSWIILAAGPTPMHAVALAAYALAMTRTYNRRLDDAGK